MKVAFVAMPYTGMHDWERQQHIWRAATVAAYLWDQGYAVICPHTNSANFSGSAMERSFYEGYLELVRRSDVVVAGPGWQHSKGARYELELAQRLGKTLLEFTDRGALVPLRLPEREDGQE